MAPLHRDIELQLLVEAVYLKYHFDFRDYATASLKRRAAAACEHFGCRSLSQLQDRVLHEPAIFPPLLDYLTVQVSEMFRDPSYFRSLRREVVPLLRTYPSLKIWVAGCSNGEEAYSLAVLLHEEHLLERTLIYATDINPHALRRAELGIFELARMSTFSVNHHRAGGLRSLSDHFVAAYGNAIFDKNLRRHIVFSDHSLATDSVFAEVQFVSCRNVLIYFDRQLQDRALNLFRESLCRQGFLGLGAKESLRFSACADAFQAVSPDDRIFRRID